MLSLPELRDADRCNSEPNEHETSSGVLVPRDWDAEQGGGYGGQHNRYGECCH